MILLDVTSTLSHARAFIPAASYGVFCLDTFIKFLEPSEEAIDAFFEHFKAVMKEANAREDDVPARVLINTDDIDDSQQPLSYLVAAIRREAKHLNTTCCIYVAAVIRYRMLLHIINAVLPMLGMKNYRYRFFPTLDEAREWLILQTAPNCV